MRILVSFLLLICATNVLAQGSKGFSIRSGEGKADIFYNGKLLTSYCTPDSSRKPVLFPVNTLDGITVTRSYPYKMVSGERTDHPHHTGIWMNYESVNGLDFWNNSTAIPVERRDRYGTIFHRKILREEAGGNHALLVVMCEWKRPDGKLLLTETTNFKFHVADNNFIIDRETVLMANELEVVFKDVKDGMLAIRVARELELPSKEASKFVDDKGNVTNVPPSGNDVTGMYYGSTGLKGDSVWGSKGPWVMLTGKKDRKDITIGIIDNPKNTGYPTYWHARGYGLFAANPLGRKVFSNGKEELNFTLKPGESERFQYRIVISSGKKLTDADMNRLAGEFAK